MIRSILLELDAGGGFIEFPKRVQLISIQGIIPKGDLWKWKTESLGTFFVDAAGNNFYTYMQVIDNSMNTEGHYVNYKFDGWNVLDFTYSCSLAVGAMVLTFDDFE